jgi:hypothetical protein
LRTGAVGRAVALAEPAGLLAVTRHAMRRRVSFDLSRYRAAVAPATRLPLRVHA